MPSFFLHPLLPTHLPELAILKSSSTNLTNNKLKIHHLFYDVKGFSACLSDLLECFKLQALLLTADQLQKAGA